MTGREQILKATMGVLADLGITPPEEDETMKTKTPAVARFYALQYLIGLSDDLRSHNPDKWTGSVRQAGFDALEFRVSKSEGGRYWVGDVVMDGLTIARYISGVDLPAPAKGFADARAAVATLLGSRAIKVRRPDIEWVKQEVQ